MAVPNLFNFVGNVDGDALILTGVSGKSWRIRQLNIQNRDASANVNIEVKSNNETVIGPILLQPTQLLSVELASEEHQQILILEDGQDLIVSTDVAVDLTVFGFAGLN